MIPIFLGGRPGPRCASVQGLHLGNLHRQGAQRVTDRSLGLLRYVRSGHHRRMPPGEAQGGQPKGGELLWQEAQPPPALSPIGQSVLI